MKIEPFSMELFNDGKLVEIAHVHDSLTMIVTKVNDKIDSQLVVDTAHILAIAEKIKQGDLK